MRLQIITLPDQTWTAIIDGVDAELLKAIQGDPSMKHAVQEATGARGVLIVAAPIEVTSVGLRLGAPDTSPPLSPAEWVARWGAQTAPEPKAV